jgi:hypothetical protein
MTNPYSYIRQTNGVKCHLEKETDLCTIRRVSFPSAFSSSYLGNSHVLGEYYFPNGKTRAPLAILIHGMGDRSVIPCRLLARTLAKRGIASFILYLVFHTYRVPESIKGRYPYLSSEEWFASYQISVIDVHQVLDWITTRSEIDHNGLSVVGISFGSFISSISMALDSRIKAGVLIESGGNSDNITKHSFLLRRQYKLQEQEYRRNQELYFKYLSEVSEKGFENVTAAKNSYLTDPLTFSKYLLNRPLLMVNALFDEMIPRVSTLELWKSCGKPPIYWYPSTHASIWVWYPLIGHRISHFLESVCIENNRRSG